MIDTIKSGYLSQSQCAIVHSMSMKENIPSEIIIDECHKHYSTIQAIYVYGSYADGSFDRNSDIDIALLLDHTESKSCGSLAISPLQLSLEKRLKRSVDLVNLRHVSTVLQIQVIDQGYLVLGTGTREVEEFEMYTISQYQHLNYLRRELLDDFWNRDKISSL